MMDSMERRGQDEPDTKTDQNNPQAAEAVAADPAHEAGRWAELIAPRYLATTLMLCMGVALFAFNGFLVTTVLPTAVADIGGGALLSWSLTLYLVASIAAGASAALLKARYGARTVLVAAALVFLAGTLIAAFAGSMSQVLVGRVAQGLGEGVVAALCYALIPDMFPSRLVPKVFGAEATVWAVASFGGPVGAGYITETVSWRAAFLVNAPLIAIFLALALVIAPSKTSKATAEAVPLPRLIVLSLGLLSMLIAGLAENFLSASIGVLAAMLLVLTSFRLDRNAANGLLPKQAFSRRSTLGLGLWVVLLMPLAQATSSVYLVFSLQHLFGYGPTAAGALGAVMAMSWSLVAIAIANLHSLSARRVAIRLGPLLQVVGIGLLMLAIAGGRIELIIIGQIVIGAAFGASWGYLSQMLMDVAPDHERDKTSALLPTLQSAGFALGAAVAGLAANSAGFATATGPDAVRGALTVTFALPLAWAIPAVLAARKAIAMAPPPWQVR
ncbi:MFS transporter [Rhizobium sp. CECT 9324]|uniref:MFS transporter n=1 Tax=Rhizobium sp. CECT 9324 TaxID=2845820 RepID=UPI001E572CA1|nr:MFS transporter [Rhizobium sp. CECT 9324]